MKRPDPKAVLRDNVDALMRHRYGKANLSRLARETGIGVGSAARISEARTSVGIEVLERVAAHFDIDPWMLLVPQFDPANPPVLQWPSEHERGLYAKFLALREELARYGKDKSTP